MAAALADSGARTVPAAASTTGTQGPATPSGIRGEILKTIVKGVIKAIKSIPGLFKKLVTAVKNGYTALKKFWNEKVPTWIKNLLTGWSLYDIWSAIKDVLGL